MFLYEFLYDLKKKYMKIFEPRESGDLNGILRNNQGIFTLEASSTYGIDQDINYIVKDNTINYWCSNSVEWQYFIIKFQNYYVKLANYTMSDIGWSIDANFPIMWTVSGCKLNDISTNCNEWTNISNVVQSMLSPSNSKKTYQVTENVDFVNQIKFTNNGVNSIGMLHFCVSKFDIFGILTNSMINNQFTNSKLFNFIYFLYLFIIICL